MTQKELARLSHISVNCLRDMEHCCSNVTTKKLLCVAKAFGLSLMELNAVAMREELLMEMIYDARVKAGMMGNEDVPSEKTCCKTEDKTVKYK